MKLNVYSAMDRKIPAFGTLLCFQSDAMAERSVAALLRGAPDNDMTLYPGDFDLYRVATFDSDTGVVESIGVPMLVFRFDSLAPRQLNQEVK